MAEHEEAPGVPGEAPPGEVGGESVLGKRNLEEEAQWGTGAEAPAAEETEPSAVNNAPVTDFELAQKKAAEIAARLGAAGAGADPNKRPRTEGEEGANGSHAETGRPTGFSDAPAGYTPAPTGFSDGPPGGMPYQAPEQTQQFDEVTRKVQIPNAKVGLVIGKGGETIKQLQYQSRARIQVTRDQDTAPGASYREIEVVGTPDAIAKAEQLINDIVNDVGGPGRALAAPGPDSVVIKVPNDKVGLIIGKGGETIKSMQTRSGARIQVQSDAELEPGATERTVTLSGNPQATAEAERAIKEVISGDRPPRRFDGPPGGGGYGGRGGYRSGPPSGQWGGPQGGYRPPSGPPSYGGYPAPAPAPAPYYGAPPAYAPQQAYPGYDQSGYGYAPPAYGAAPAASGAAPAYDYSAYQQPAAAPAAAGQYDYSQQYAQGYGQQGYYQAPADPASQGYYQQPAADGSAAAPAAGYDYSQGGAPAAAPTQ